MEQRSLFVNSISLNTKRLSQNSYQESVRYSSIAHCAIGTSTIWRLAPSPLYLRVRYYASALAYHYTFRKNKKS